MIYTERTKRALNLCFEAHKDQRDKSGQPYVFHPFHLAEQMSDEATTIVALLHDVVEDTEYTFDDLEKMEFGDEVMAALKLLTHNDDTPYMEYVANLKHNPIARAVKLADLAHNSDMSRMHPEQITEKALKRAEKYRAAIKLLNE